MKFKESDILLPVEVAGLKFRNPFYVASGPTAMTIEQLRAIEANGWGGASLKLTIDPTPYINRYPRYKYWKDQGILSFTTERRLPFDPSLPVRDRDERPRGRHAAGRVEQTGDLHAEQDFQHNRREDGDDRPRGKG